MGGSLSMAGSYGSVCFARADAVSNRHNTRLGIGIHLLLASSSCFCFSFGGSVHLVLLRRKETLVPDRGTFGGLQPSRRSSSQIPADGRGRLSRLLLCTKKASHTSVPHAMRLDRSREPAIKNRHTHQSKPPRPSLPLPSRYSRGKSRHI